MKKTILDISLSSKGAELLKKVGSMLPVQPELIEVKTLTDTFKLHYKRFQEVDEKNVFREKLVDAVDMSLKEEPKQLLKKFREEILQNGAVIIADIIAKANFSNLVTGFDKLMQTSGSKSWIHSYENLAKHPEFLLNKEFNNAFLHPLIIYLIAYSIGGPIRIVDARGKDAEPISVLAQDNMLHIDNTPFNDEYKIILTWKKGEALGPVGQNFVFIPSTHLGVRNCLPETSYSHGAPWSTENASIFITPKAIEKVFNLQQNLLKSNEYNIVEVTHPTKPVTTVFAAGSLVHHRYRTEKKNTPRSCIILAFHRTKDNYGKLIDGKLPFHTTELENQLFSPDLRADDAQFLDSMTNSDSIQKITFTLNELIKTDEEKETYTTDGAEHIKIKTLSIEPKAKKNWDEAATEAPTVEDIKKEAFTLPLGQALDEMQLLQVMIDTMRFDKHGPLDLILYADNHEEVRKWARNRIREMPVWRLEFCLKNFWISKVSNSFSEDNLFSPAEIKVKLDGLSALISSLPEAVKLSGNIEASERIAPLTAFRSLAQLATDLGETLLRCTGTQAFLSTSLFSFWCFSETLLLLQNNRTLPCYKTVEAEGTLLINHYMATLILARKQSIIFSRAYSQGSFFSANNDNSVLKYLLLKTDFRQTSDMAQRMFDQNFGILPYYK